jgi:hypothetical protein
MRSAARTVALVGAATFVTLTLAHAPTAQGACDYAKWRHVKGPNVFGPSCPCNYNITAYADALSCSDGSFEYTAPEGPFCPCDPAGESNLETYGPDDSIIVGSWGCEGINCDASYPPDAGTCDGVGDTPSAAPPLDPGCGNDEYKCSTRDRDPFPVRFSTGQVEITPITAFSQPTPSHIFFGVRLYYDSFNERNPAILSGTDAAPAVHSLDQDTHFMGAKFLDNVSDRLDINVLNQPAGAITWTSGDKLVTFGNPVGGTYLSYGGTFQLTDRGSGNSPRWVVTTRATSQPMLMWAFDEISYTTYGGNTKTFGRLARHALVAGVTDYTGYYGYAVNWNSTDATGRIQSIVDSLGRELDYNYGQVPATGTARWYYLSSISYVQAPGNSPATVATFNYTDGKSQLDRVDRYDIAGYTRFLYYAVPS